MSIELYPNIAKVKRNGVYQNLPGFVQASGDTDIKAMIANSETSTTAQFSHKQDSFFILNDILYQADENIAVNDIIAVGTNCHVAVLGDNVTALEDSVDNLNSLFDEEYHESINMLNPEEVGRGYYWTDGFHTSTSYVYTGLIRLEQNKHYSMQNGISGVAQNRSLNNCRFAIFYKEDGVTVTGSATYVSDIVLPTEDSVYFRGSYNYASVESFLEVKPAFVEGTTVLDFYPYFEPYTTKILKNENNNEPYINSLINATLENLNGKLIFKATSASLSANTNLICCDYSDNKKNEYIELTAFFSSFDELTISHGKTSYGGGYLTITNTKIIIYNYDGTQLGEYEHGLTLSDFINIIIYTKNSEDCRSSITIMTAEGDYSVATSRYYSSRAAVLCNANFAMTNITMKYVINDAKEDVWVFGDSYVSLGDPNRWATQLVMAGHKKLLIDGYGGAKSENIYPVLESYIELAKPKYIAWCLGMNDGDNGAINSSWKGYVDSLLTLCEEKGITPILATIPNVPSIDHTYKNAYVKSLGVRYIDFAKAVNAESAGATWYTGMLSQDNTHPSALGAKALMRQFLLDVPEVLAAEN